MGRALSCCILCLIAMLAACDSGRLQWNARERFLVSPSDGYSMQFPDWGEWTLGEIDGKADIRFCAVNKDVGVVAMLCQVDSSLMSGITTESVRPYVRKFAAQPDGRAYVAYDEPLMESRQYLGSAAVKFRQDVSVVDESASSDTLKISYVGYIFDRGRVRYGFVVTLLADIVDNFGDKALDQVFDGLTFKNLNNEIAP